MSKKNKKNTKENKQYFTKLQINKRKEKKQTTTQESLIGGEMACGDPQFTQHT